MKIFYVIKQLERGSEISMSDTCSCLQRNFNCPLPSGAIIKIYTLLLQFAASDIKFQIIRILDRRPLIKFNFSHVQVNA